MATSYESRYSVEPGYIQTLPTYAAVRHGVEMSGGHQYTREDGSAVVCYNPYLIVLFRQRELLVWDAIKQQDVTIDGGRYYRSFADGFDTGVADFNSKFIAPQTIPYSPQEYIEALKRLYYGDGTKWPEDHCLSETRYCPITLEHSQFEKIGYWSGFRFQIELLMEQRPGLFNASSRNDDTVNEDIKPQGKPSLRQIALIYHYTGRIINELNNKEIAAAYGHNGDTSGHKLYNENYLQTQTLDQRTSGRDAAKNIRLAKEHLTGSPLACAEDELRIATSKKA